jgi:hypothetical protein
MSQIELLNKILDAVDRGVSTKELREDYKKHILSGETKKVVINSGGEGLKVSYAILEEMKNRGDKLAAKLLEKDDFHVIDEKWGCFSLKVRDENDRKRRDQQWTYLETSYGNYHRENKTLIAILEEKKITNIGGWTLEVCEVPVEDWAYEIVKQDDHWGSETIVYYI